MNISSPFHPRSCPNQRGSVLLVALLFSVIIAISLTSYIKMSTGAIQFSQRSFANSAAISLVDSGLEQAMWAFNEATSGNANAWDGWDSSSGTYAKRDFAFDPTRFSQNQTALVKVSVENYTGTPAPKIVARAIVTFADGPPLEKWVAVELKRRSLFANGLVAKQVIKANGNNIQINSWDSNPDPAAPRVPYSAGVATDTCPVGTVSIDSVLNAGNADLFGYAAVGGPSATAISVGPSGRVGPFGTPSGFKDPERISTDFTTNMAPVDEPETATWLTPASITETMTISTPGTYYITHIDLVGKQLTIDADVDVTLIIMTDSPSNAIRIGGGAGELVVGSGSSLTIYTAGDISIAGSGISNPNYPESLQIYGTNATSQSIDISGGASFSGVIYAPNASVSLNGGGSPSDNWDAFGSIVANDITLNGNVKFHYDLALADFGEDTPFGITKWRELTTSAERVAVLSVVDF